MSAINKVSQEQKIVKPPALNTGDRVALLAPSSRPPSQIDVSRSIALVKEMGFEPVVGEHVLDAHGYMAGVDRDRIADLNKAIADPEIKGIFMICGGYGSLPLLPHIDYDAVKKTPKVLIGSGDPTAILLAVHKVTGMVVFYGPNLIDIKAKVSFRNFSDSVRGACSSPVIEPNQSFNKEAGEFSSFCYSGLDSAVEGLLSGGNLTSLVSLMGTDFEVDCRERLLFLNDYQERNDILDRWLTTLTVSGAMRKAKAVIYGEFIDCYQRGSYSMHSIFELILERMQSLNMPHVAGFPLCEGGRASIIPIGIRARVEADGSLCMQETAFSA